MKQNSSLIRRQWLASALCLPILVGFSAFTLNRAFVNSLDSAEKDALLAQVYSLIALAEPSESKLFLPSYLSNPRLETPESGLYARVVNEAKEISWRSNSLEASPLSFSTLSQSEPGRALYSEPIEKNDEHFLALSFTTIWEIHGVDRHFTFEVFHSQSNKYKEIQSYQQALFMWLGGMAILLIAIQSFVAKWGLRPLKVLAGEIEKIEQGSQDDLKSEYPKEILPVTKSLSKLLVSENAQRSRYKNALSDLAHSLKTPLAVVRSQLADTDKDQVIDEQIERMSSIVSHQLRRASAEVKSVYGPQTNLANTVERLRSALNKVYRDKNIHISSSISPELQLQTQENDAMEVFGNILENACKYGRTQVRISATQEGNLCVISIEDDGEGVPEVLRNQILTRGARADTSKRGQGIGLAVAVDILSSYNGALNIETSELGGAKFGVCLPVSMK